MDQPEAVRQGILLSAPDDLANVALWLGVANTDDIAIRLESLPIEAFMGTIEENRSSYGEFPEDEARMARILKRLRRGEPAYPVFVEDGDPNCFIMEGRHRIVAFHEAGLQKVDVAFVRPKPVLEPVDVIDGADDRGPSHGPR